MWIGRGGGAFAVAIPFGGVYRGNEELETIDRTKGMYVLWWWSLFLCW